MYGGLRNEESDVTPVSETLSANTSRKTAFGSIESSAGDASAWCVSITSSSPSQRIPLHDAYTKGDLLSENGVAVYLDLHHPSPQGTAGSGQSNGSACKGRRLWCVCDSTPHELGTNHPGEHHVYSFRVSEAKAGR